MYMKVRIHEGAGDLKKLVLIIGIIVMGAWGFGSVFYESKILTSDEAIKYAEKYLQSPPPEWENSLTFVGFDENFGGDIKLALIESNGVLNKIRNKKEWEITVIDNAMEITVVMNAHSGELLDIYGPLQ